MMTWQISQRKCRDAGSIPIPSWVVKSKEFKMCMRKEVGKVEWNQLGDLEAHLRYKNLIRRVAADARNALLKAQGCAQSRDMVLATISRCIADGN
eukprot:5103285-Karenia_brevis.AAC.1